MKRVVLKYTPQLHFEIDHALERGDRVMRILNEIQLPEPDRPDGHGAEGPEK